MSNKLSKESESANENKEKCEGLNGVPLDEASNNQEITIKKLESVSAPLKDLRGAHINRFKMFIGLLAAFIVIYGLYTEPAGTTNYNEEIVKKGLANNIKIGTVFLKKDMSMEAKDYSVAVGDENGMMDINVWDFAAEDGDYVQVFVNGDAVTMPFVIKHQAQKIAVPAKGIIQIKGIRDGGGGITYAVQFARSGVTYFNLAPLNGDNTYTLVNTK